MTETGRQNRLPAAYRIMLALSLALFLHSVVGAALVLHLPSRVVPETERVELTLVAAGNPEQAASSPASEPAQPVRKPDPAEPVQRSVSEPVVVTRTPSEPASSEAPEATPERTAAPAPASTASTPSQTRPEGLPSPLDGADSADITQIPTETGKQSPSYEQELARRISAEMGQQRVALPDAPQRQQLKPIELEVRLMRNGALVDARITRSSGVDGFDQSALRAALRASPYPEPPASQQAGALRYRLEFYLESAPPG